MEILNVTAHIIQTPEISNWCSAMAAFTKDMLKVEIKKDIKKSWKDNRGRTQIREYASLDNIINNTKKVLIKNELFVVQSLSGEYLATKVIHSSGEYFIFLTPFSPMSGSGTTDLQNVGGGITYLKRYTYTAALNLSLDYDSDGEKEDRDSNTPEQKVLPNIPIENLEDAAKIYLSDDSLERIEKKYFISDSVKMEILKLAIKIEENRLKNIETDKEL